MLVSFKQWSVKLLHQRWVIFIVGFAIVGGVIALLTTHAATPFGSSNADQGTLANGAQVIADNSASDGHAVKFGTGSVVTGAGNCPGLPAGAAAFCDTFDSPTTNPSSSRSGELNDTIWGVSRELGSNNLGQGQYDGAVNSLVMQGSCPTQTVTIESDIKICNGQLNEVVNDNPFITTSNYNQQNLQDFNGGLDDGGTVTSLAMYPKQPFDFANRTGKIVFDVGDNSGGGHWAWPEFWMSSTPNPDPFVHFSSWQSLPQYGFGIRLDAVCVPYDPNVSGSGYGNCAPNCSNNNTGNVATVASAITINNYQENDSDGGDASPQNPGTLKVIPDGCVAEPTQPGQLNHFEIDVSENQIDVYGTNAFSGPLNLTNTPLIHLASIPNANLGFTRGLIWLEDVHYNADKEIGTQDAFQAMHTFTWDNVGFDGPVLPRDLAFDAADNTQVTSPAYYTDSLTNLGWVTSASSPATLTVPNVSGISAASGGLLTFNYIDNSTNNVNLSYSLNGNATHSVASPMQAFPASTTTGVFTISIPISLSEMVPGANTVKIWSDQDILIITNVDLVMQGAGGPGGIASP